MSKSPHLRVSKALQEQARFGETKAESKHRQSAFDAKYHLFTVLPLQCYVELLTKASCGCCFAIHNLESSWC